MHENERKVVDIEELAKKGEKPPRENVVYRFRVGKVHAESEKRFITGREIMMKVGLDPNQNKLYQRIHGGQKAIGLDQEVDLAEPGLERFDTIPLDPTEG